MAQKPVEVREDEEDEEESDEEEGPTLRRQFVAFVRFKNEADPGTHILLSQSNTWMKQAGVIKVRKLTPTDTGVCFFKFKKYKLSYPEYLEFLRSLADYKKVDLDEMIDLMANCGLPQEAAAPHGNMELGR